MTITLSFDTQPFQSDFEHSDQITSNKNPYLTRCVTILRTIIKVILLALGLQFFVFIHEFGHALACKIITGQGSDIILHPRSIGGVTSRKDNDKLIYTQKLSWFTDTWISFSGPLLDVIVCSLIIVSIFALTHYLAIPIGVFIALRVIFSVAPILVILGEFTYMISSVIQKDHGDFGQIREQGGVPVVCLYAALLTSIVALCILGMVLLC